MTTKIPFLLKQTKEQRAHLDELAAHVGLSRTAYVQSLLDEALVIHRVRKEYTEANSAKAPLIVYLKPSDIAYINEAVDESATAEAQVTKAPPDHIDIALAEHLADDTSTPCACDGNCAGCKDAEGACDKAPATGGGEGG